MSDLYNKASLVMTPQLVDTGKVYSIKPEDRKGDFTFTRSSAATRVNADGNIEKETQNLFTYSNTFSDSSWLKADTSVTGGQAGYDGTNDAWLLEITGSTGFQTIRKQPISYSGVNTFSFYAKAGTLSWLRVRANVENTYFDIGNGVVGSTDSSIGISIEAVGNGYYRCVVPVEGSSSVFYIYPASGDGNVSQSSGNIYIQDAQWEQGLVARDYIETTTTAVEGGITDNVPRLDYTDSSCPALLLEPQRTNIVTQSEYFEDGYWNKQNAIAINTNSDLSPEGIQNATELDGFDASNFQSVAQYITLSAGTYTFSVFLKKTTGALTHYPAVVMGSVYKYVIVNSTTGTYVEATGTNNNDSVIIESWDADWWRVSLTNTLSAGAQRFAIYPALSANGTGITTNASGTNVFWGAQVEEGSYATSYIPTYGSSVTRVLETCQVEDKGALINSEQGTLYFEGIAIDPSFANVISFSDGTNTNRICLTLPQNATNINAFSSVGGSKIDNNILHDPSVNSKYAIVWNGNSFKVFVNGVKKVDNTMAGSFSANTLTDIRFDRGDGNLNFGGFCKSYLSIASALTDQQAIDLTTI